MNPNNRLTSPTLDIPDDASDAYEAVYSQGWTDGLPVIPPTAERVWEMVEHAGLPPDHVVGEVAPLRAEATVESIAVNAVMSGCKPEYMPVVVAAVEAMCEEQFNLTSLGTTTIGPGVAVIVNGPIRSTLDINCGWNCLGPGWRANATIGRAVHLIMLNIGGARPGEVSSATHGYPGSYTLCFGEFEEQSYWDPLHVERGFQPTDSTVTVFSVCSTMPSWTPSSNLLDYLRVSADSLARMGSYRFSAGCGEALILVTPALTRKANEEGMSKEEVKTFLYEHGAIPVSRFPVSHPRERLEDVIRDGAAYPVQRPEDIVLLVAGRGSSEGFAYETSFLDPYAASRSVTKLVRDPKKA